MDLFGIFRIAVKRWYVLLGALLVTVGLGFVAASQVAPTFQVGGVLVVNIPYAADDGAAARLAGNPYFDTRTAASVLASLGESPDVRNVVIGGGGNGDYIVGLDSGRPVLMVTITDKSEQVGLKTYELLGKELGRRLAQLQEDKKIPPEFRVTVDDVLQPKEGTASTGSRTKVLLASVAMGVVLALGLCVYVDYLMRRRASEGAPAGETPGADVPEPHQPAERAAVPAVVPAVNTPVEPIEAQRTQRMRPVAAPRLRPPQPAKVKVIVSGKANGVTSETADWPQYEVDQVDTPASDRFDDKPNGR